MKAFAGERRMSLNYAEQGQAATSPELPGTGVRRRRTSPNRTAATRGSSEFFFFLAITQILLSYFRSLIGYHLKFRQSHSREAGLTPLSYFFFFFFLSVSKWPSVSSVLRRWRGRLPPPIFGSQKLQICQWDEKFRQ